MKLDFLLLVSWIYSLAGIPTALIAEYNEIKYFYLTNSKWYLIDASINVIDLVGFIIVVYVLINHQISFRLLILLYKIFLAMGLFGTAIIIIILISAHFYFHIVIPFPFGKMFIVMFAIDGIIIKEIYNQRIK